MALFRMAAAAGLLLALAPEQTRNAVAAIFRGAEDAQQALPTKGQLAEAALAYCRRNAEACAAAAREAMKADSKLRP